MLNKIIIFIVIVVVISAIPAVIKYKKIRAAHNTIANSPKTKAICDVLFADGAHPSRIAITWNNEIFYGPQQNGQFMQIPGNMIPEMNENSRIALGDVLAKHDYRSQLCNGDPKSHTGSSMYANNHGDTGNPYIDSHVHLFLYSTSSTGGSW